MGLTLNLGINDIYKEAAEGAFEGKNLLMLGKQYVWLLPIHAYLLAGRVGVKMHSYDFATVRKEDQGIDSYTFFKALGCKEVHAIDISDYEGADIIMDLGAADIPKELLNHFDYIIDSGTIEHIFNIQNALNNIVKMLKVGGKVFHYIPANNWINHGLWQLSPELFEKFYNENGFKVTDLNIVLDRNKYVSGNVHIDQLPDSLEDLLATGIDYRLLNLRDGYFEKLTDYKACVRCIAVKETEIDINDTLVQRHWYKRCGVEDFIKCFGIENVDTGIMAIWGAGITADSFLKSLNECSNFNKNCIAGFFDKEKKEYKEYNILDKNKIHEYGIKIIFIASVKYEDEIYDQICGLEKSGIKVVKLNQFFNMGLI